MLVLHSVQCFLLDLPKPPASHSDCSSLGDAIALTSVHEVVELLRAVLVVEIEGELGVLVRDPHLEVLVVFQIDTGVLRLLDGKCALECASLSVVTFTGSLGVVLDYLCRQSRSIVITGIGADKRSAQDTGDDGRLHTENDDWCLLWVVDDKRVERIPRGGMASLIYTERNKKHLVILSPMFGYPS